MLEPTPLYGGNGAYLDALYERYLRDPQSVPAEWRGYFERLGPGVSTDKAHAALVEEIAERARQRRPSAPSPQGEGPGASAKQAAVSRLIQIWTNRGHLVAHLDPLGLMQRPRPRVLELEYFGL